MQRVLRLTTLAGKNHAIRIRSKWSDRDYPDRAIADPRPERQTRLRERTGSRISPTAPAVLTPGQSRTGRASLRSAFPFPKRLPTTLRSASNANHSIRRRLRRRYRSAVVSLRSPASRPSCTNERIVGCAAVPGPFGPAQPAPPTCRNPAAMYIIPTCSKKRPPC